MRHNQYNTICMARRAGTAQYVTNRQTGQKGQVLACRNETFEVDIHGRKAIWPRSICRYAHPDCPRPTDS